MWGAVGCECVRGVHRCVCALLKGGGVAVVGR